VARREPGFADALGRFDMVLPDGIGVVQAVARLRRMAVARISFDSTSLALPVLALAEQTGASVVLVGGAPGVAERAASHIRRSFPGLRLLAALDGFGDRAEMIEYLLELRPEIVICGMGAVAQEEFLLRLVEAGWRGCGFTCGGYLDQLGSGMQYYPAWIDGLNLRWLYRLAREPRRLWRRYLIDYQRFGLLFAQALLMQKLAGRPA
jgi:N-acetylglucosaminyldiphosphoundecaprenol N-acetyl-beta-D-mannosaminyltransferase